MAIKKGIYLQAVIYVEGFQETSQDFVAYSEGYLRGLFKILDTPSPRGVLKSSLVLLAESDYTPDRAPRATLDGSE